MAASYSGFLSIWPLLRTDQCSLGNVFPATRSASQSIRHAVFISIDLGLNAKLQMQTMSMGTIKYLYKGEVDAAIARTSDYALNRAWENWARRAGRKIQAGE